MTATRSEDEQEANHLRRPTFPEFCDVARSGHDLASASGGLETEVVASGRPNDRDMRREAWTVQHEAVVQLIQAERFTASYDRVPCNRLNATRWMAEQMRARGVSIAERDAPIWAFLDRPPPREDPRWGTSLSGPQARLLRLSVPSARMLLSYHYPWAYHFLRTDGRPESAYLFSNVAERVEHEESGFKIPPPADCRRSWEKLFDLTLASRPETTWWKPSSAGSAPSRCDLLRLQATMPFLFPSDLLEVVVDW